MNSFTPTPANLRDLLAGKTVVEYVEDELLGDVAHAAYLDGKRGHWWEDPIIDYRPPHSKGDVLWCREECWICERCKVISWTEEEILCRRCNGPHQKKLAEMVYAPANQMPEAACRLRVRVEDVEVVRIEDLNIEGMGFPSFNGCVYEMHEAAVEFINKALGTADWELEDLLWKLTLAPVEKP